MTARSCHPHLSALLNCANHYYHPWGPQPLPQTGRLNCTHPAGMSQIAWLFDHQASPLDRAAWKCSIHGYFSHLNHYHRTYCPWRWSQSPHQQEYPLQGWSLRLGNSAIGSILFDGLPPCWYWKADQLPAFVDPCYFRVCQYATLALITSDTTRGCNYHNYYWSLQSPYLAHICHQMVPNILHVSHWCFGLIRVVNLNFNHQWFSYLVTLLQAEHCTPRLAIAWPQVRHSDFEYWWFAGHSLAYL